MPTYEYLCSKCERHFEVSQRMSESALTQCPKDLCARKPWGKGKVSRVIGAGAGLIFKGSGFYITDYRSDKYKEAARKDSSASAAPAAAPPAKPESKPVKPSGGDSKS